MVGEDLLGASGHTMHPWDVSVEAKIKGQTTLTSGTGSNRRRPTCHWGGGGAGIVMEGCGCVERPGSQGFSSSSNQLAHTSRGMHRGSSLAGETWPDRRVESGDHSAVCTVGRVLGLAYLRSWVVSRTGYRGQQEMRFRSKTRTSPDASAPILVIA